MSVSRSFSDKITVVPTMCIDEWVHMENNPITCVIECEPLDNKYDQLSIVERYKCAVYRIIANLSQLGNQIMYDLKPFLVGKTEDLDVIEKLPSIVLNFKVKCQVIENQLFILDIVTDKPHGHGSAAIQNEVCRWSNNHDRTYFSHTGDTNYSKEDGSGSYAPDCVIFVGPRYTNSNAPMKVGMLSCALFISLTF